MTDSTLETIMDQCEALAEEEKSLEFLEQWLSFIKEKAAAGESLIEVSGNAPESWQRAALVPANELSPEGEEKLYAVRERLAKIQALLSSLGQQLDSYLLETHGKPEEVA